jgi:UDP-glucuronate 4-epimerase
MEKTLKNSQINSLLVTGVAGFIGAHLCQALLLRGYNVIGVDNLNDYYGVTLKQDRLKNLQKFPNFCFYQLNIHDRQAMEALWQDHPDIGHIIHLAAQAGVRYSLENPYVYIESNIMGQMVILELCRHRKNFQHLIYASSSSVYGGNDKLPFSVEDRCDHPVSLYGATKKAGETIAQSYARLYGIPMTGLRFFTVYGPWGRPDMAPFIFTKSILEGRPIAVFNHGHMQRDFTYIDDIVRGILGALDHPSQAQESFTVPHRLYNLGSHQSKNLRDFIQVIEDSLGKKAILDFQPLQKGDIIATYADIEASKRDLGFEPRTSIDEGIPKLVEWYRHYYGF